MGNEGSKGQGEEYYGLARESVFSIGFREHNVGNLALHVVGLNGSGDKVCLFLEDWKLTRAAFRCNIALDMLRQEIREAW